MHCFTVLSTIYDARNRNDDDDAAIRSHPASRSRSQNSSVSNVTKILEASARIQLDIVDLYYHMASVGKIKVMLKDVNLQIKSGEMCAIMGPTGAGKRSVVLFENSDFFKNLSTQSCFLSSAHYWSLLRVGN